MKGKNVKSFRKFNEKLNIFGIRNGKINESDKNEEVDVRVKDLISFLQRFDPEMPVYLDRDGWPNELWGDRYKDISIDDKIRTLIDDSGITHRGENYLIINN